MRTEVEKMEIQADGTTKALVRKYVTDAESGEEHFIGREWTRNFAPHEDVSPEMPTEVQAVATNMWTPEMKEAAEKRLLDATPVEPVAEPVVS